jgi:hypothetical protein
LAKPTEQRSNRSLGSNLLDRMVSEMRLIRQAAIASKRRRQAG